MTKPKSALTKAIEAAGGQSALAEALGVSVQAITKWKKRPEGKQVPADRVVAVEAATDFAVRRQELRPDLYLPAEGDCAA
jgi:DNA-binding transcriptional regulator YdaS (Cro superfamily)